MYYINVKTEKQTQEKRTVPFCLLADTVDLVKKFHFPVTSHRKEHLHRIFGLILNSEQCRNLVISVVNSE